jgi:hypothetical protein
MAEERPSKFYDYRAARTPRNIDNDKFICGGALAALFPGAPPLLPALLSPQVLFGMLFNGWLLVYYLTDRLTIAEIAVFYFFELGLYLCLYAPRVFFHILADRQKDREKKKEDLKELFHWVFAGTFLPVVIFQSYTQSMTGYNEQLLLVLGKLKLALIPFALQFCLGAFYFLTRDKERYAYESAFFPLCWYIAGQVSVLPFIFFIAVPGWFLTDSFKPGMAAFLLLRINNEVGPQLAAMKFGEDITWNLKLKQKKAFMEKGGREEG